jgi:hypothetical protein
MDLKQKVIIWQISIGVLLVVGFGSYFTYFFIKDILPQPPEYNVNTQNLFIEKAEIDIASIKKTKSFSLCSDRHDKVYYSLYEDRINGFLGENVQENEQEYNRLYKKSVFTFTEQFIILANQYFEQSKWDENGYVQSLIKWIKGTKLVEYYTPNWNALLGFESNISCYNEMLACANRIKSINHGLSYIIPSYSAFLQITNQKDNLASRDCRKNSGALSNLNSSYNDLNSKLPDILEKEIIQYNKDFITAYEYASLLHNTNARQDARKRAIESAILQYQKMEKWKNIYNNLNDVLKIFYDNIYF